MLSVGTWAGSAQGYLGLQRTTVELLAVCHLDNANGVANRRQRLIADFNGYWIFVLQVNAVEQFAPSVITA
jgi:hypothetical protein